MNRQEQAAATSQRAASPGSAITADAGGPAGRHGTTRPRRGTHIIVRSGGPSAGIRPAALAARRFGPSPGPARGRLARRTRPCINDQVYSRPDL
ncbi:hypothetical protein MOX02_26060 [Methylobacterium oxalidis]|uniref:Uncharacterized protein n=1 Tax=Methylobacterium oxalidis TaxID=944322 RepID=A0A512J3M7_9HYPH|nr:hypothetical protein MOX02_26060 [Methylobacterium oxalidis]GJE33408.1 hypothetical protein LDDCCGHA_3608 [Methylobacterium oxalidis]GLS64847.1 hypothetical protein GCM10007888_32280 [Methylobacterium oxalidis]